MSKEEVMTELYSMTWVNSWFNKCVNPWINVWVSKWVNPWNNVWVSMWVNPWVKELTVELLGEHYAQLNCIL